MSTLETAALTPIPQLSLLQIPSLAEAPADIDYREVASWLLCGDVGSSSKTVLRFILGLRPRSFDSDTWPSDLSDVRRCLVLVQQVPSLRAYLPRVAAMGPFWAAFVARWEALEAALAALDAAGAAARHLDLTPASVLDAEERAAAYAARWLCYRAAHRLLKEAEAAAGGAEHSAAEYARRALATWDADTETQVQDVITRLMTPPAPEPDKSSDEPDDEPEEEDEDGWDD